MESVAIVGVGCRFPGADGLEEFWEVLTEGRDCLSQVPADRWCLDAYYDPDGNARGKSYIRRAGFIKDLDAWDNRLFGVSDMEAASMDPQQRLAVECSYRAMEDAGLTREQVKGSNTGVYIGVMSVDYNNLYTLQSETTNYTLTGTSGSNVAARVSYVFDLRGNSLMVNTACSSSLEAIHLGCQALRAGDVDLALCGGVNSLLDPLVFVQLSRARMASPTSASKAFAAAADGYARGEGCGMLLLKRYDQAVAAGDRIWAVVHTGANQDGRTVSPMTAPSWRQQKQLFHDVFRRTGLDPADVDYIEAHGTGTKAGDPVEIRSLGEFFLEMDKTKDGETSVEDSEVRQRWLGSVKTNIGHLESAAGVAGIIKVLLMMRYNKMVPSLHFDVPNPRIDFQHYRLNVVTQVRDWERPIKVACVNSFSFGGTNGHALLTSPSAKLPTETGSDEKEESQSYVVCFSGANKESLVGSVEDFANKVDAQGDTFRLRDVAFTSCCRRDLYAWRLAVLGESVAEISKNALTAVSNTEEVVKAEASLPNVVFIFCGMGTGWRGMGREMMASFADFRQTVQDIDTALRQYVPWSLTERLQAADDVTDPIFGPIGIFTCQVALARLWQRWGVQPDVILGQSVGEVAAACVAGVLDIQEAVKVIYHRSVVLAEARGGKMLIIGDYDISNVEDLCKKYPGRVNVSLYYNPRACSVSGDSDVVDAIRSHLEALPHEEKGGLFLRTLNVSSGYHSHHMEPCRAALADRLASLAGSPPDLPIVSCVTSLPAAPGDFSTGDYWARSVRQPCLFYQGLLETLAPGRKNVFLEIGPKAVLRAHLKYVEVAEAVSLPSMLEDIERRCFLHTACHLHQMGLTLDWQQAFHFTGAQVTDIPRYFFTRTKQLVVPEDVRQQLLGNPLKPGDLRLVRTTLGQPTSSLRAFVEPETLPSVYEHRFQGSILLPGALHVELALEAASLQDARAQFHVAVSAKFRDPVAMRKNEAVCLDVTTEPLSDDVTKVTGRDVGGTGYAQSYVIKRKDKVHAEGKFWRVKETSALTFDLEGILERCNKTFTAAQKYTRLGEMGFSYGDRLKVSGDSRYNDSECLMEVKLLRPDLQEEMHNLHVHPALLDGVFQAMVPLMDSEEQRPFLPVGVGAVVLRGPVSEGCYVYTYRGQQTEALALHQAFLLDRQGRAVMEVHDFAVQFLGVETTERLTFLPGWRARQVEGRRPEPKEAESFWEASVLVTDAACSAPHLLSPRLFPTEEALRSELKKKVLPSHARVIFLAAPPVGSEVRDDQSQDLYEESVAYCDTLRVLVLSLAAESRKLPVFVVTHRAWSTELSGGKTSTATGVSPDTRSEAEGLAGAALWGMVRNILREQVYPFLRLIDLHVPRRDVITSLPSAVSTADLASLKDMPEIAWSHDGVMVNEVQPLDLQTLQTYRRQTWDEKVQAVLSVPHSPSQSLFLNVVSKKNGLDRKLPETLVNGKVTHSDDAEHFNGFSEAKRCNGTKDGGRDTSCAHKGSHGSVVIRVEEVTLPSDGNQGPLGSDHVPGLTSDPIMTSELSGVTEEGMEVVAAWPVEVGTMVVAPESCCLPRSLLPHYKPGALSRLLLLHALSGCLDSDPGTVGVLADEQTSADAAILSSMLKARSDVSDVHQLRAEKTAPVNGTSLCRVVVSLVRLSPDLVTRLADKATSMTMLIFPECLLPAQSLTHLCKTVPGLKCRQVSQMKLSSPSFLLTAVPTIAKWLDNNSDEAIGPWSSKWIDSLRQREDRKDGSAWRSCNLSSMTRVRGLRLSGGDRGGVEVKAERGCLLRGEGVYLVVGGLTGLGWECVRHLARRGAGGLVLLGRRQAGEEKLQALASLESQHGCRTLCLQADVCQLASLQAALCQVRDYFPGWPIKGVFFGAAVLDNSLFELMTPDQYRTVMKPKVLGLCNVHTATLSEPLDYFVVHSSVTGVLGNEGQTNYAAANAFQDALVAWRRAGGLAGTALSWGPLSLGLMVGQDGAPKLLEAQGISFFDAGEVGDCLDLALMREEPQLMLLKVDKDKLAAALHKANSTFLVQRLRPLLTGRAMAHTRDADSAKGAQAEVDVRALLALSRTERLAALQRYLVATVGEVFGVEALGLSPDSSLFDLGVDSMLAMAMVNRVAQDTRCRLSVVSLLQDSSLRSLASDLEALLVKTAEAQEGGVDRPKGEGEGGVDRPGGQDAPFEEGDKALLSAYEMRQYITGVTLCVDVDYVGKFKSLSQEHLFELLHKAARICVSRHPLLHTAFEEVGDGPDGKKIVRRKEVPVEDSLDWRELGDVEQAEWKEKLEAWTEEPLHLPRGPMRFLMQGGSTPKLRFMMSCVVFDMVTTQFFMRDFRQVCRALLGQEPLPPPPYDASVSTKTEIEQGLHPIRPRLEAFWRAVVSRPVAHVSLNDLPQGSGGTGRNGVQLHGPALPPSVVSALKSLASSAGASFFQVFMAAYHVLLSLATGHSTTSLGVYTTARAQLPSLARAMGNVTNLVPVVATVAMEDTLAATVDTVAKEVRACLDSALFPTLEVKALAPGDEQRANLFRHTISMTDSTELEIGEGLQANFFHQGGTSETVLGAEVIPVSGKAGESGGSSQPGMRVTLIYQSHLMSASRADAVLSGMQCLLEDLAFNSEETLATLAGRPYIKAFTHQHTLDLPSVPKPC